MKRALLIASAELLLLVRSRVAWIGVFALVCLSAVAGLTSLGHMQTERAHRAVHQQEADALFEAQPARHPHRMVHYGQYAYRPVSALAAFDPGVDPYTGTVLYLEGHRQNSATFAAVRENASLMRFGALTPAFVLQTLAPLLLVFLGFSMVAREREGGALKLLRAHGARAGEIVAGKVLALAAVAIASLAPAWLVLAVVAAASPAEASAAGLIALGYGAYLGIWVLGIVAVSAMMKTSRTALLTLVAAWSLTAILAPRLAADAAQMIQPLPSRAEADLAIQADLRQLGDSHNPDDPFFTAFRQRTLVQYGVTRVEDLPFNYRGALSAEGEALTAKLFNDYAARGAETLHAQARIQHAFAALSPAVAVRRVSMAAAASDLDNHIRFLEQAEAYRFDLIQRLNALHRDALSFADDAARSRDPQAERRTRVAAENWAAMPDFQFSPATPTMRRAATAPAFGWLGLWIFAALAFAKLAARRLARSIA